ncbi:MAG: non-ribosomal peptide synthetase, partial [Candidatus Aminicenantes bacterium]
GRKDHQVKIRGFRIEPGEIESRLLDAAGIKEAVVTARTDNTGQKYLCAYVVSGKALEISELRVLLSKTLPDYMVPSYFVQLDKMPLTSSGKIDRKALPEPGLKAPDDYIAPGDEVEFQLVEIWSEVLGVDKSVISTGSDFFQLGGHSLKAILLVSKIDKVFHVKIPLQEIFTRPTLIELSKYIKNVGGKGNVQTAGNIPRLTNRKEFELSYTQKSLWVLTRVETESSYNIPIVVEIKGKLNRKACEDALKYIVERHEALRTIFTEKNGIPKQVLLDNVDVPLGYEDLSGMEQDLRDERIDRQINRDLAKNFPLSSGPLIRGKLFKQEKEKYTLYLNICHLICDGWSIGILVKELSEIYHAFSQGREPGLPFLPVRYVDYVAFRNESIDKGKLNRRKDYWLSRLKEPLPLLDLPLDRPRPEEPLFKGASSSFCIEDPLGEKLKVLARQNNCSLFMVLLSAYFILLRHLTLCSDIIIGVPFAGRDDPILEDIVGFFVNTLPIRIHFDEIISLGHLITEVKKSCLEAYENSFPYSELVRLINPARRTHQSPIFSTIFNMHNIPMRMDFPGLEFQIREVKIFYAKFDIKLDMDTQEYNNRLTGRFEYDVTLFKKETIQHIIKKYDKVLKGIIQDPGRTIEDLLESIIDTPIFPSSFGVGRLEI